MPTLRLWTRDRFLVTQHHPAATNPLLDRQASSFFFSGRLYSVGPEHDRGTPGRFEPPFNRRLKTFPSDSERASHEYGKSLGPVAVLTTAYIILEVVNKTLDMTWRV